MNRAFLLFPFQCPFLPDISKAYQKNCDKHSHFYKTKHPKPFKYHGPWNHEYTFYIKYYENHGYDIKFYRKSLPGVPNWLNTTLIWRELFFIWSFGSYEMRCEDSAEGKDYCQ